MSFETALRFVELSVALALLQRGAEHLRTEPRLFLPQMIAALLLFVGVFRGPTLWALWCLNLWQLHRFQGPYNGGADKMAMLILCCLSVAHLTPAWSEVTLAYLAVQLVLSYFVSGWVKLTSAEWCSGQALTEVFHVSAYPVSENLRRLADRHSLMRLGAWSVIGFEVLFPFALLTPATLVFALTIAALFHLANAMLFGLNRFLWVWIAAYPALIWIQARLG